jgi:hypothetical protein
MREEENEDLIVSFRLYSGYRLSEIQEPQPLPRKQ